MAKTYDPCPHKNCRYHREGESFHLGNCRYLEMTGHSRILGLTLEQAMDKVNCPKYKPRSGKAKPIQRSPVRMDHTNARIRELYDKGSYDWKIAEELGISKERVIYWRRRNRLPAHREPAKTKFDWDKAMELYRQGMTDMQIAEELGCASYTVSEWRSRHGLTSNYRPEGRRRNGK